jgi:hypothetical protein
VHDPIVASDGIAISLWVLGLAFTTWAGVVLWIGTRLLRAMESLASQFDIYARDTHGRLRAIEEWKSIEQTRIKK